MNLNCIFRATCNAGMKYIYIKNIVSVQTADGQKNSNFSKSFGFVFFFFCTALDLKHSQRRAEVP